MIKTHWNKFVIGEKGILYFYKHPVIDSSWGAFNNHVDIIFVFLDHPPTPRGHILFNKRGQKWQILDHLPTPSCPRGY